MNVVREASHANSVLVVGHNPGLHELALALSASGDTAAPTGTTASIAWVA
jgi:phosphohistidine phosphatase SixA